MSALSIVICVFGLGILAAAHEIGHFLVAKRLGIKMEELSIFIGPSLFSWKRKGIAYHIRLIPFGAYVRFTGLEDEDGGISNPDSFFNQSKWKRLLVSLGGPAINFLLGIVIFFIMFASNGFLVTKLDSIDPGTQIANTAANEGDTITYVNGDRVLTDLDFVFAMSSVSNKEPLHMTLRSQETGELYDIILKPTTTAQYYLGITRQQDLDSYGGWTVAEVSPEQNNGNPVFKVGDSLLSINGVAVTDPDFAKQVTGSKGEELTAAIVRNGIRQEIKLKPIFMDTINERGLYIQRGEGLVPMLEQSVLYAFSIVKITVYGVRDIIEGKIAAQDAIAGPVGIANIVSDVVDAPKTNSGQKVENLGFLAGLISVGLAFTNLMPLPGLDGNALVLLIIEMIRGKKLSMNTERVINVLGFIFLITLTLFVLTSDIMKLKG